MLLVGRSSEVMGQRRIGSSGPRVEPDHRKVLANLIPDSNIPSPMPIWDSLVSFQYPRLPLSPVAVSGFGLWESRSQYKCVAVMDP